MFTVVSIERLERLVYLAESWNGPMSAAVAITNSATEIPLLVNTWLNTSALRKNVDIHLIFDDNVILIAIIIINLSFNYIFIKFKVPNYKRKSQTFPHQLLEKHCG